MGFYSDRVLPHVINPVMNNRHTREIRARACSGLQGEVVEIGFGTGHNLPFLPATITRLCAVEPSGVGVRLARECFGPAGSSTSSSTAEPPTRAFVVGRTASTACSNASAVAATSTATSPAILTAGGLRVTHLDTYYGKGEPKPYAAA